MCRPDFIDRISCLHAFMFKQELNINDLAFQQNKIKEQEEKMKIQYQQITYWYYLLHVRDNLKYFLHDICLILILGCEVEVVTVIICTVQIRKPEHWG